MPHPESPSTTPSQVSEKAQGLIDRLEEAHGQQFVEGAEFVSETIDRQDTARAALSEYLGELERDRERLDWIDTGATVVPAWGPKRRVGVVAQGPRTIRGIPNTVRAKTARKAIDAARSQEDA